MIFSAALTRRRYLVIPVAALLLALPGRARATGGEDMSVPSALPFYLSRLPAKSPSEVFLETTPRPAAKPTDFQARLLDVAARVEAGREPTAALLATVDELLIQARLDPDDAAALCNLLNDAHDLFTVTPPVPGKPAADYLRWRLDHAESFGLSWAKKKPDANTREDTDQVKKLAQQALAEAGRNADTPAQRPLRAHWLYLRGALSREASDFEQVIKEFPDRPRAEAAHFMLARLQFGAFRALANGDGYGDQTDAKTKRAGDKARNQARDLFEDYARRYPAGRFVADVPGWLGAIAFDSGDYLAALDLYLRQADTPGHPEVLKSAGFMCERCLSHLSAKGDQTALDRVAEHPKLAMSLVYLVVNSSESDDYNGKYETPAEVAKWRRTLLPRLAAAVTAHQAAYQQGDWQGRYLAILAQAASGVGDQKKALALCDLGRDDLTKLDDLAFIRLAALQRSGDVRATVDAGRDFLARFPQSVLARGAALRVALALRDDHQAGAAVVELLKLQRAAGGKRSTDTNPAQASNDDTDIEKFGPSDNDPTQYPETEVGLEAADSVLTHDPSGAEYNQTEQIIDALLNFAPLPELAAVLPVGNLDGAFAAKLRAVLAQRFLAEEENFARAREFVTPAQWSVAAAAVEKADADARAHPTDPEAAQKLGDAWAAARGKLVFAPLEEEKEREAIFSAGGEDGSDADGLRLVNAHALGIAGELGAAVEKRDELRHARDWWLRAADAAPAGSPGRAHALWLALKAMPALAGASPALIVRAAVTDAHGASRKLYERLRRECPGSREARDFAVYYDFPKPPKSADPGGNPSPSDEDANGFAEDPRDPEYAVSDYGAFTLKKGDDPQNGPADDGHLKQVAALRTSPFLSDPARLAREVAALRRSIHADLASPYDAYLQNCLDDLDDFLKEDRARLTPGAVRRYVALRIESLAVESWGSYGSVSEAVGLPKQDDEFDPSGEPLGQGKGVDDRVFNDIRAAYKQSDLAPFKDYLDFLAIAVVANHRITVTVPGQEKDGQPLTYTSRDYPKVEKLTEAFLNEQPHSRKREAARLLYARAIYDASRPRLVQQFVAWPQSGTFAGRSLPMPQRVEPFDPTRLGAALNAYDKEFPQGRYTADIRNLRGLLAWRTQDWKIALELTLKTLGDKNAPDLQPEAALRLANIFSDGLTDDTERARLVATIRAQPGAPEKLRAYLKKCDEPLRSLKSWLLEASGIFH